MYRFLLFALVIWADQHIAHAYFDEAAGVYDDALPIYDVYPESDALFEDDVEIGVSNRNAVPYTSQLWPSGEIPYVIDPAYPDNIEERILVAMREVEYNVNSPGTTDCIHFKPRTTESQYIYVIPREHACSSAVGWVHRGRQDVSVGRGCEHRGIIMHELMHAIGFHHEQSRPDRDSFVTIDTSNVASGHTHNYNKHSESNTLGMPYDYASVMHYNAYEFAVDRTHPVITPKGSVPPNVKMGQRLQFSPTDTLKIQKLYHCTQDSSHTKQRVNSDAEQCNFANGLCPAFSQDTTDDFDWEFQSSRSPTGPGAGDSTGIDNYAVAKASGHTNKYARFQTGVLHYTKVCVDWWFFNHGGHGYVKLRFVPASNRVQTMKSYGAQASAKWYHVYNTITVNGGGAFKFMFEARPNGADIAIDDINIYEGECI